MSSAVWTYGQPSDLSSSVPGRLLAQPSPACVPACLPASDSVPSSHVLRQLCLLATKQPLPNGLVVGRASWEGLVIYHL